MATSSAPLTAAEAQRRVDRIAAFEAELNDLIHRGVVTLTPEQRQAIGDHHGRLLRELAAEHEVNRSEAADQLSRGTRIAAFLATVALIAAVYSLVARFWGRFELPLQAALLCAFPLAALVATELAAARDRSLYVASIFAATAFGTYWLAAVELSRLVGVPVVPPVIWGGALFGLALAIPYGFRVVLAGALVALIVALAGSAFQAGGLPWTHALEFPELAIAAAFGVSALGPSLSSVHREWAPVVRGVGYTIGFAGLLMLTVAGRASLLPLATTTIEVFYQVIMFLASLVVVVWALKRGWIESVYIGAGALTLLLLTRFSDWFWDVLPRYVFFLVLAALALATVVGLRRLRARVTQHDAEAWR